MILPAAGEKSIARHSTAKAHIFMLFMLLFMLLFRLLCFKLLQLRLLLLM